MSQKKASVRDYKFSDGQLKQSADSTILCTQRDATQFATRGVVAATLTTFSAAITAFDNVPTDEELLGAVSVATENKNLVAENVRVAIRTIRSMSENKFGVDSAIYRTFGFGGLSDLSDIELYRTAKRVGRVATTNLAALATEGLTTAMITNLTTLATNLDTTIDLQDDANRARDIKTQERIVKGNAVYKELVRLCNIGKDLFAATDKAKYNDYVIYDTPSGQPPTTNPDGSIPMP